MCVKKDGKNVRKNTRQPLDITADIASAIASGNPNAALSSLPEVIKFYHTGKGLYLGNFFDFLPSNCNKKHKDSTHLPLEKIDVEKRLEKKLNDVNCFNNSIENPKKDYLLQRKKTLNEKKI